MMGVVVVNDVQNLDDRGTMKTNTSMKNINLILIQEIMFLYFLVYSSCGRNIKKASFN